MSKRPPRRRHQLRPAGHGIPSPEVTCPHCSGVVAITAVQDALPFFVQTPTVAQEQAADAAWHCHGCGAAGLIGSGPW